MCKPPVSLQIHMNVHGHDSQARSTINQPKKLNVKLHGIMNKCHTKELICTSMHDHRGLNHRESAFSNPYWKQHVESLIVGATQQHPNCDGCCVPMI